MAKAAQELTLAGIALDPDSEIPMYRQLYSSLRGAILQGRLQPGYRLPASRVLAEGLGISRNTVLLAFDYLFSEGYLKGKTGSGTYVTDTLPEKYLHVKKQASRRPATRSIRRLSHRGAVIADLPFGLGEPAIPFRHGWPALKDFPMAIWSRILARTLRTLPAEHLGYGDPAGFMPLRKAITSYLHTARAVRCEAEQIIIVNGSQQALDLAARVLLDPGDIAWIENPGYIGTKRAFTGAGIKVVAVPVDDEGLAIGLAGKRGPHARLVYVTPSHQYPLGVTMSLSRRLQLLEWADKAGSWILEDDYDSEYRYIGHPLSSLQGLDVHDRVIYLGTFSKVLFPALRLGYMVVPKDLINAFVSAKALSDRNSPTLEQAVLSEFIREGHFGRHIRRMRVLYHHRQRVMVQAMEHYLRDEMEVNASEGGMHEIGWLTPGTDDQALAKRARDEGVVVTPLSSYSLKKWSRPGLVLGYAAFEEKELIQASERLAEVLKM